MIRLLALFLLVLASLPAPALDRVTSISSKIQSSLSGILPRSDFLVVVNRVDTLDDGGASQSADGTIRMLPGLQLGVDAKGELIRQDQAGGSYSGPVAIHVMIDSQVGSATFKTIEKLLPEIVGGLRDDDELKISRGPLRQPPPANSAAPQISIQNSLPEPKDQFQENLKFIAVLLVAAGLFFLLLSRMQPGPSRERHLPSAAERQKELGADEARSSAKVEAADFAVLDPESVGLFLLKEVRDRKEAIWGKWVKYAPAVHQREVFRHLPAWILSHLQNLNTQKNFDESQLERISLHDLFNEIVLIEQSMKTPNQKRKAFLQWFPAEALRYVPRPQQKAFSDRSRRTLWSIRPDLGNFVRVENLDVHQMIETPRDPDIESCFKELQGLTSVAIDGAGADTQDVVKRWIGLINQLTEFSPVTAQVDQARAKLKPEEFDRLIAAVAHLRTPLAFTDDERKEWLRLVEPDDYHYWVKLLKEEPPWDLRGDLRPMRFAMFQQSSETRVFDGWTEDERKLASERILDGMRKIIDPSWRNNAVRAA